MRTLITLSVALSFVGVSTSFAASPYAVLTDIDGKAFVKQDGGVADAAIGDMVLAGQDVVVGLDGGANLMMDGCAIVMEPGARFHVPQAAPCAVGEMITITGVQVTPANGVYGPDVAVATSQGGIGGLGMGTVAIAVGGVVGASVLGFAVLSEDDAASGNGAPPPPPAL
jgi:hypothetical protein